MSYQLDKLKRRVLRGLGMCSYISFYIGIMLPKALEGRYYMEIRAPTLQVATLMLGYFDSGPTAGDNSGNSREG